MNEEDKQRMERLERIALIAESFCIHRRSGRTTAEDEAIRALVTELKAAGFLRDEEAIN